MNAGPLNCVMHPCLSDACRKFWKISTDAAAAAAAECHCTVSGGLAGLCCTCFDQRSCLWGGMRGCSYLASYDELLYICVHTPSIAPTPTVGGTLILADGFHLRLCILLSISNVILSHLNLRAGSADSPHLLGNVAALHNCTSSAVFSAMSFYL